MPAIIDKEAERLRILEAFQECIGEKPFDKITLRDIAAKAHTPHPTVLTYFKNKKDIITAYVNYMLNLSERRMVEWSEECHASDFGSKKEYIKTLFKLPAKSDVFSKNSYTGTLNIYIFAQYDPEVAQKLEEMFHSWTVTLKHILSSELGIKNNIDAWTEFMFNCVEGICLNTYNGLSNDAVSDQTLDLMAEIFASYPDKEKK